jgi:hypothetical protein
MNARTLLAGAAVSLAMTMAAADASTLIIDQNSNIAAGNSSVRSVITSHDLVESVPAWDYLACWQPRAQCQWC